MKFLHVVSSVNPADGGTIEAVRQFAGALATIGHDTEIVSLDHPQAPWVANFPVPLHPLGNRWNGSWVGNYSYSSRLVPWLREHAADYDVILVNGIWQYHSYGAWRALAGRHPYYVFTHGMLDPWFKRRYPLKHIKKWLYWRSAEYAVLRDARGVLFTCEEERLLARQSFRLDRCNEKVVNFGTAGPAGDAAGHREAFLSCYPHLRDRRIVLSIGRIHAKKGGDLLIQAFARLCGGNQSWHLVMAGPDQGGWAARLRQLADRLGVAEQITWTGMVTGDAKWGAFYSSEVVSLPSHSENFGFVVAEALACGVPVLISDKVNIWPQIVEDGAGLAGNDDLPGMCSLLQQWLSMPEQQRQVMATQARACFESHFEISRATESLMAVIRPYVGGQGEI